MKSEMEHYVRNIMYISYDQRIFKSTHFFKCNISNLNQCLHFCIIQVKENVHFSFVTKKKHFERLLRWDDGNMISLKTKIIYVLHLNSECYYKLNGIRFYMIVNQFLPNTSNYITKVSNLETWISSSNNQFIIALVKSETYF